MNRRETSIFLNGVLPKGAALPFRQQLQRLADELDGPVLALELFIPVQSASCLVSVHGGRALTINATDVIAKPRCRRSQGKRLAGILNPGVDLAQAHAGQTPAPKSLPVL